MNRRTVLYREDMEDMESPLLPFTCEADDAEHAREQCCDAYPSAWVVFVGRPNANLRDVYAEYNDS